MSAESNEWISIGDLMAGVVGVVMLMFVSAAVVSSAQADRQRRSDQEARAQAEQAAAHERAQARAVEEQARAAEAQRRRSTQARLVELRKGIIQDGFQEIVQVDPLHKRITLREATFASGSACVRPQARRALARISQGLRTQLEEIGDNTIRVEGHTDAVRVILRTGGAHLCALFDDNFTLSAARAREARNALITGWPEALRDRVTLAGLGDTQPVNGDRFSPLNRRIEIFIQDRDADRTVAQPPPAPPSR